jgi:hypothetical protein
LGNNPGQYCSTEQAAPDREDLDRINTGIIAASEINIGFATWRYPSIIVRRSILSISFLGYIMPSDNSFPGVFAGIFYRNDNALKGIRHRIQNI